MGEVPPHVPTDLVVDFDFHNPPGVEEDVHLAWKRLHDGPDIFWTPHNGGHWVATRADDIEHMMKTYEVFSNEGLLIPKLELPYRLLPLGADPPDSTPFRELILPAFTPSAVESLERDVRALCRTLIGELQPRGQCEFMRDLAQHLPIEIFLRMVDLPLEDRPLLLEITEQLSRGRTNEIRAQANADLMAYLDRWIVARKARPGPDVISRIVTAQIDGQPITDADIRGVLLIVVGGGLDTVAATLGFIANFLARSPEHRRQLRERPEIIPQAVEELLRRFGVANQGRMLTRDCDYKGAPLRKDDRIMLATPLAGLDERRFERPLEVDFQRSRVHHTTFGYGVHRCAGAYLARTEIKVFLQEWLARIADFRIQTGAAVVARSGPLNGMIELPLAWEP